MNPLVKVIRQSVIGLLWVATCLFACLDTELFVYLSLSQTLIAGLFILLMAFVGILWRGSRSYHLTWTEIIIIGWTIYSVSHAMLVKRPEIYKLIYLIETLGLTLLLPDLLRRGLISRKSVENGFLLMTGVQVLALVLQSCGIMDSYNEFFPLTGFSENPNVVATLLAVCIPCIIRKIRSEKRKAPWCVFLVTLVVYTFALKSRTAVIGLIVYFTFRALFSERVRAFWNKQTWRWKTFEASIVVLVIALACHTFYMVKRDSTDSRILIWKVSCSIIKENPMGIGMGMFEHDYNLKQGEYFTSGNSTASERYCSNPVYMAYNDFIEHGVECGIPGLFFMLAFYGSLVVRAYRIGKREELSVIAAFFVMSWINFVYASVQPWFVLLCYGSFIVYGSDRNDAVESRPSLVASACFLSLFACFALSFIHFQLLSSQLQLGWWQKKAGRGDDIEPEKIERLSSSIGTSEAYWRFLSERYLHHEDYENALRCILTAKKYTSSPDVFFSVFNCYDKLGQTERGLPYIIEIRKMLPLNLTSRLVLLKWYDCNDQDSEALQMAREIARTPVKIQNRRSMDIKKFADSYIKKHQ